MVQRPLRAAIAAAVACLAGVALHGAVPTFWQVSTEAALLEGEVENLSIDGFGRLTLGPSTTQVFESSAPFLWTLARGADGAVYAGSGNDGQVFRIDASGESSVFFDAEELEVHALAPGPSGSLYVGTSPDGKVYKVDPNGSGAVFFDPPDRYIWSLAVDSDGNVFAATGDKGIIYKIAPDGEGTPFYETKATHAMSLAFDRDGRLIAGTESPGRVFRIDATGRPFVLLDSPYNEIRAIRVGSDGVIYAAAVSGGTPVAQPAAQAPQPAQAAAPVASVSTQITGVAVVAGSSATAAQRPATPRGGQRSTTGAVYRIQLDGGWDLVWESRVDSPYDLAFEADGSLLLATGGDGKVYRLSGDPVRPTLITRVAAQQVTAFLPDPAGRLFATSNPAKVLRLSVDRAAQGSYVSSVRDAQAVATWGAIKWHSVVPTGATLAISTRAGNTDTPDETWSDWSEPYADPSGSAITSPRARYLQWRAALSVDREDSPVLTSVTAAYLPRNARPRVTAVTIYPPGTVFQRPPPVDPDIAGFDGRTPEQRLAPNTLGNAGPGAPPSLGRRAYEQGLLSFTWRADDSDGDDLSYEVLYRREGETDWKVLRRNLADAILVWDTTSVPNGRYLVRVAASDALSNSPSTALAGWMESTTFDVDNTAPVIAVTSVEREAGRLTIAFDVRDDDSSVQKADYSLDGERWQTIYPRDGIADSRQEGYELVLEGEAAVQGVLLRATDALNNTSSQRGEAPVQGLGGR